MKPRRDGAASLTKKCKAAKLQNVEPKNVELKIGTVGLGLLFQNNKGKKGIPETKSNRLCKCFNKTLRFGQICIR